MRDHQLTLQDSEAVLNKVSTGHLATLGQDGFPYVTPVHYVYADNHIYVHGALKGTKMNNIQSNPCVSFEVTQELGLIDADAPCNTNTRFQSVIVKGEARIVDDSALRQKVLDLIVKKYTPQHEGKEFPIGALKITGVIAIKILAITGKYYT
jgi:nitroimidazol reductase NimA-like FMN-containing flavoprotein (pyridoxamine 5'-phosphate oxidase superfamily)